MNRIKEFLVLSRNENNIITGLLVGGEEKYISFLGDESFKVGYVYKMVF